MVDAGVLEWLDSAVLLLACVPVAEGRLLGLDDGLPFEPGVLASPGDADGEPGLVDGVGLGGVGAVGTGVDPLDVGEGAVGDVVDGEVGFWVADGFGEADVGGAWGGVLAGAVGPAG